MTITKEQMRELRWRGHVHTEECWGEPIIPHGNFRDVPKIPRLACGHPHEDAALLALLEDYDTLVEKLGREGPKSNPGKVPENGTFPLTEQDANTIRLTLFSMLGYLTLPAAQNDETRKDLIREVQKALSVMPPTSSFSRLFVDGALAETGNGKAGPPTYEDVQKVAKAMRVGPSTLQQIRTVLIDAWNTLSTAGAPTPGLHIAVMRDIDKVLSLLGGASREKENKQQSYQDLETNLTWFIGRWEGSANHAMSLALARTALARLQGYLEAQTAGLGHRRGIPDPRIHWQTFRPLHADLAKSHIPLLQEAATVLYAFTEELYGKEEEVSNAVPLQAEGVKESKGVKDQPAAQGGERTRSRVRKISLASLSSKEELQKVRISLRPFSVLSQTDCQHLHLLEHMNGVAAEEYRVVVLAEGEETEEHPGRLVQVRSPTIGDGKWGWRYVFLKEV